MDIQGEKINQSNFESVPLLDGGDDQEKGCDLGDHVKPIIYGGLDGIVSIFVGVLVAVLAGENTLAAVLGVTFSKLFAGAFSMGVGEMLSTKAEVDYAKGERAREEWELANFREGEIAEMIQLYTDLGYEEETAKRMVDLLAKNDKIFLDAMVVEELGIPPDQEDQNPYIAGLMNFSSFMLFGFLPILPFLVCLIGVVADSESIGEGDGWRNVWNPLFVAAGLTFLGLIILAVFKARLTGLPILKSVAQTLFGGILSAAVGGGVGYGIFSATGAEL
eukprot:CAMPEP_0201476956 /NCGR_PEP_ID=MMETSP0151_2-20130828/2084_1 /ASSEMBLY_ACC=CAM_ASM_000257 /TAXON_ID=200890 /ORGANISM="Paramoeba atlantica, Strain 621/1 / CCAP 1560/9" /LENGTH=275 /DNA_ID=CAMNT_0047857523 /DNA_START=795 /DNA_END=1622 /DNA_ORIENTATION=+